jgi:hypothetical protein
MEIKVKMTLIVIMAVMLHSVMVSRVAVVAPTLTDIAK